MEHIGNQNPRVSPTQIAHFGIRTTPANFEKMVQWHLDFFGGETVLKNESAAFLRWDDEHHRMVILANKDNQEVQQKQMACGVYHIAFSVPTLAQLADSYEQKADRGILPEWPVNHGPSTSMYYFDPDRNEFEMQVDNYDTAEEAHAFMVSQEFTENPVGADIAIDEWIKRVRNGEDEAILKKRPNVGPRKARWQNSIYFEKDPASDSPHSVIRLEKPGVAPLKV